MVQRSAAAKILVLIVADFTAHASRRGRCRPEPSSGTHKGHQPSCTPSNQGTA
jgi:hypothetical protein